MQDELFDFLSITKMSPKNVFPLQRKSKISASRKLMLKVGTPSHSHKLCHMENGWESNGYSLFCVWPFKSLMVAKAKEELEEELEEKEEQKAKYLEEKTPPIQTIGMSLAELQVWLHIRGRTVQIFATTTYFHID